MKLELDFDGRPLTCLVTVLCHHGEHGDFQAFPTSKLALNVVEVGRRLKAAGAIQARVAGGRLLFDWNGAAVTMFTSGRMILEGVRPDRTTAAVERVAEVFENAMARHAPAVSAGKRAPV